MMKRLLSVLVFALVAVQLSAQYRTGAYNDLLDSENITAFKNHVNFLSGSFLEGRAAGSEGELEAAEYVRTVLEGYGVDVLSPKGGDLFGIKQESGDTLTSRNVVGVIEGYDKSLRDRYIVVGARLDNIGTRTITIDGEKVTRIYNGANGNASGVAMMLELARMLKQNSALLKRSVIFIGLGSSLESYVGAWYFLNRSFSGAGRIDAMINLDILGKASQGFYAFTSSNADMNDLVKAVNGTLQPIKPVITSAEPFPSDHRMFYGHEIPSVLFTTGTYPEYGTERDLPSIIQYDGMERELEYIYSFSVELANAQAPVFNPDKEIRKQMSGGRNGAIPYYDCDYKPSFLGSTDPRQFLQKWVYAYLKYPQEAVRKGIQGRVLVDFIIDERGKVTDVKVLKGVDPLLDNEAVKVVSASPDWKPARHHGKKVKSEMSVYVEFKLERNKK